VIGGGIHGAQLALAASQRGLKVLLLEAADFGSGASGNSLRILHGGLRYLQTADLPRFYESVAERRWHAQAFPELVEPLACLMPLYAQGLKRRSVMRIALKANDLLSWRRNDALEQRLCLSSSGTFSFAETVSRFPLVRQAGLEGSAQWYDYFMRSSERILIETLRRACALGAQALNYTRVVAVQADAGRVTGLVAEDQLSGQRHEFLAERICNCGGSGARALSATVDREFRELFVPSLAFNVLFECEPLGPNGLAVAAPEAGAPVYFLCPSPLGIWAGTEHVARPESCADSAVQESEIAAFMQRINRAIPTLNLTLNKVRHVCSGLLPVSKALSVDLTGREVIIDHGRRGGLKGLYSVTGIKFTTARKVAAKALDAMVATNAAAVRSAPLPARAPLATQSRRLTDGALVEQMPEAAVVALVREVAADEAVTSADDFCLRRTNWIFTARDFGRLRRLAAAALVMEAA
jgi:glycerol-3-phosphate dehydrogenase